jgi:hypothetical protein
VRKPLADLILFGELGETGGLIKVDLLEDKLKLTIS